jgi:hypothetical protein
MFKPLDRPHGTDTHDLLKIRGVIAAGDRSR